VNSERATEAGTSRFDVRSADGTSLAVWVDGDGPPLVLVHGALSDHTRFGPLVDELRDDVTTFSMDRRGRGGSGDAPGYSIDREFEDVAAVVDAVADRTSGPVALWGHSYGADCAMGGAALTRHVDHLVLYEPGLGFLYPADSIEVVEQAVAAGDSEAAVLAVLVGVVGATDEEIDAIRSSPLWPTRLATAPTVPRELRTENGWVYGPGQFDGIAATTLVLAGWESPPAQDEATHLAAAAISDTQIRVLEGHGHFAFQTDPAMVAGIIREFIGS
jgi:pimeloyl-ACP methyl ester carboxylesterase